MERTVTKPVRGGFMRRLCLAIAMILGGHAAVAAHRITVDQLKQTIEGERTANKSDDALAKELSTFELTEQLTPQTLSRMHDELKTYPKTTQSLGLLADLSAFLPPPPPEIPDSPAPDIAAQKSMINEAIQYVVKSLRHLP